MIDIEFIRNNKEMVKLSERNRFRDDSVVDEVYNLDEEWRKARFSMDQINKKMNALQKEIKEVMKNKKKISLENLTIEASQDKLINERNQLKEEKEQINVRIVDLENEINKKLRSIGNILKDDVVISKDECDNKIITQYRTSREVKNKLSYPELFAKIKGCDNERGARISGHRGYYLFEELSILGMSLSRYAIDFMRNKGYQLVQTPVFMSKEVMKKTCQLSDFDDQLYSLEGDNYLIATSEQPLTALHMNENLFELPLKYVGHSLCFRKEAGAHGKDNQGIFRVHQFEKIEQFVVCEPKESENAFKEMMDNVMEFYKSLDISFNVVSIVSGELNDAAAIKYDLECYFPNTDRYRELVSCSNCTDYQSRDLNVRYGYGKENNQKIYAHMLNCTVVAVQRMLCCLVENYQNEDCIIVPDVLVKYFGKDRICFK